jgi:hypothetical protein
MYLKFNDISTYEYAYKILPKNKLSIELLTTSTISNFVISRLFGEWCLYHIHRIVAALSMVAGMNTRLSVG